MSANRQQNRFHPQKDFEHRLGQQLGDMDASIRRNFDKLLAQHLGVAVASICHAHADAHARLEGAHAESHARLEGAHADAQARLEGGLLALAGIVRRLEAKLDRLAESVHPCSLPSALQQPED
jgi:hypothetical protein